MSDTDIKLVAMTVALDAMTMVHEKTLHRRSSVERKVRTGYQYDSRETHSNENDLEGTMSDDREDQALDYAHHRPLDGLANYNIKPSAWKDRALLGLGPSGETTEYYDITQFIDPNSYQASMGTPPPRESKSYHHPSG